MLDTGCWMLAMTEGRSTFGIRLSGFGFRRTKNGVGFKSSKLKGRGKNSKLKNHGKRFKV